MRFHLLCEIFNNVVDADLFLVILIEDFQELPVILV